MIRKTADTTEIINWFRRLVIVRSYPDYKLRRQPVRITVEE